MISKGGAGNEFKNIVARDIYQLRDIEPGLVDYFFDFGANLGFTAIMAKHLFPLAHVIAIEPSREVQHFLSQNVAMYDIKVDIRALGNGEDLHFKERGHILDSSFVEEKWVPEEQANQYTVGSAPLHTFLQDYGCTKDANYIIKLNAEGGEYSIKGNREAEAAFVNAFQVGMMIHYRSQLTPFEEWPEWEESNAWIRSLFQGTHYVKYHTSNKSKGRGFYHLRKMHTPYYMWEVRRLKEQLLQANRELQYINDPSYLYSDLFFRKRVKTQRKHSRRLGFALARLFQVKTMVDFGCGLGSHIEGALAAGTKRVKGYEVAYENAKKYIPDVVKDYIEYGHVGKPMNIPKYDCVLSIEVAEHLVEAEAETFIDNLTRASSRLIVLTASTKGAIYHFNRQRKEYWIELVEKRGFKFSDIKTKELKEAWKRTGAQGYLLWNLMVFEKES
jgi:FkbM family methyltransferase